MINFKSKRLYGAIFMAACLFTSNGYAKEFKAAQPQLKLKQAYRVGEDVVVQPSAAAFESLSKSYTIHHPGATYIKPNISLNLSEGDYITVSNPDGTESYQYPFGGPGYVKDVDGSIWSLSIEGDTAIVTVHTEREAVGSLSDFGVVVNKYERGFSEAEKSAENFQIESTCGADNKEHIECVKNTFPSVYNNKKPTARLRLSGSLCSGFMVSGTRALLMTNNHCVDTQTGVARMEAQFEYQNTSCTSGTLGSYVKVAGKSLIKTDVAHDMSLVELMDLNKVKPFGYYQLDGSRLSIGTRIYSISHPKGHPKKASVKDDQTSTGYCQVDSTSISNGGRDVSYYCDTEGGSSGSAIFSYATNKVVALHHYGGCYNDGVKMELILPMVQQYLNGTTPPDDTQAPSTPTGLNGTAGKTSVSLSWNASSDNVGVTGYDVYKNGAKVGTATSTQYTVSGLTANTTYTFKVKAKDAAGNASAYSSQISVTTLKDGGTTDPTGTWKVYTMYKVGDIVTYNGVQYKCITGHTAYPGWSPDVVPALWSRI